MSMHGFIFRNQGRNRLAAPVFSILSGFLVVLQLLVMPSQITHAASLARTVTIGSSQSVDFAQVSVLRLVATYKPLAGQVTKPSLPTLTQCTGLGVMISSWASVNGNDQNNWLLTDGSLVNPRQPSCVQNSSTANLSLLRVDLYFNTVFNPELLPAFQVSPLSVHCMVVACSGGAALLSFATTSNQTFPHLDLATSNSTQTMALGLRLQNASSVPTASVPAPSNTNEQLLEQYVKEAQRYLTPQQVKFADATNPLEGGSPIFNSAGELTAIALSNRSSLSVSDLAPVINTLPDSKFFQPLQHLAANVAASTPSTQSPISPLHNNTVYENWKIGISSYYHRDYVTARTAFQKAAGGNALFTAPAAFEQSITSLLAAKSNANKPAQSSSAITISFLGIQLTIPDKKMLIVLILAFLTILLVLLVAFITRARFLRRRRVLSDYAEADRRAELDAQRINAMEVDQNRQSRPWAVAPAAASAFAPGRVKTSPLSPAVTLPCPNCGTPVRLDDKFCSNCRMALAATESGYHRRVVTSPMPPIQQSPVSPPPSRSIAELPTLDMTPGIPFEQPMTEMAPGTSAEQPTLEMSPAASNGQIDPDKTVPYSLASTLKGQRLGIAVGTRSDPGIKRKYKPNEDSLFAAYWQREADTTLVPFGLFVVADGMGGHANGQDASRTAIQTIIDFMLPKLSKMQNLQSKDLEQFLGNAVQHANLVVHQHNMELRADMGTTVTATLVVGATAYVSNVGDSRTYLYRVSEGLKKVTNDHSVVASLVEAGIIKPDDIYTHPKRNQIYRSLGEKAVVEVDSFVVHLQPGDKLLLCSDGLWDMVRDPKIESVLKNPAPDPTMAADALIQAALEGGGEDNVSVIVISLTETPQHAIEHGIQLLAKPDAVQMPQL